MTMKEGLSAQERFLAQNVKDAWRDFEHSLESAGAQTWDWVVVTGGSWTPGWRRGGFPGARGISSFRIRAAGA